MYLQKQRNYLWIGLVALPCGLAISLTPAIAQEQSPPPPPGITQSPTNFSGTVERYLINPAGLVDGLLLDNGLLVKFPPHLSSSLVSVVKPGNSVTVSGYPGTPSNFGQEIKAYSITDAGTQHTIVDQPPAYPPPPPTNVNYSNLSETGTAQRWLVGRGGEINGILLSSGTQVKFPPHIGYQLTNLARQGTSVQVQGFGTSNSYGKTIEATSLTVDGQTIQINSPPPRIPPAAGVPPAPAPVAP